MRSPVPCMALARQSSLSPRRSERTVLLKTVVAYSAAAHMDQHDSTKTKIDLRVIDRSRSLRILGVGHAFERRSAAGRVHVCSQELPRDDSGRKKKEIPRFQNPKNEKSRNPKCLQACLNLRLAAAGTQHFADDCRQLAWCMFRGSMATRAYGDLY